MPRRRPNASRCSDTDTYKDLRSHRRLQNRQAKQSAKYYGYRGVDPAWVNQPYISFPQNNQSLFCAETHASADPLISNGAEAKISTWTKHDMFLDRETNIWPLDRRHHVGRHIREKYSHKYNELALGRRMRQRNAEWEFAIHDARDLAGFPEEPVDHDWYWENEQWLWEKGWPEIYNEWGEPLKAWMDLDGERFFDAWFEDGGFWEGDLEMLFDDRGSDRVDKGVVCLEGGDEEDDGFLLVSEYAADENVSVWSMEDEYEMVEAG
ncbi:hypothetical protein H2200_005025 [Cladophialophora chaetospira]|uniref:Uncharacterized protein n=1 Tax=Cladophialophora chaetospira TaxID=386627 RepID=A0AA38XB61_9EURO|nr:hypothetical protein H2200_005025 [Cladophialophora chaetospira]